MNSQGNVICAPALLGWLLLASCPASYAQTFSYDGNRWYEIEVSIFTHERPIPGNELLIPDQTDLSFPESIRRLTPASAMFKVDFENSLAASFPQAFNNDLARPEQVIGPVPANQDESFRLTDFDRDAFIALGEEEAEFSSYNRELSASSDHRLLYHAVWRQPVLNRLQASAIYIGGGEAFGGHYELEGSLLFSYNVNRVDVETSLWLVDFSTEEEPGGVQWQLPSIYTALGEGNISLTLTPPVRYLSYMNESRAMISNELHYLDHPDFGLLVQIRPYQLPEINELVFE